MIESLFRKIPLCALLSLSLSMAFFSANAFTAQDSSAHGKPALELYTPYSRISVSPGQTVTYSLTLINNSNAIQTTSVSVSGLARGWTETLKSSTWDISRVSVLPKQQQVLSLQVMVPLKVNKGLYQLTVHTSSGIALPLTIRVKEQGTYKTAFSTTQSNLEGAANTTFTFNAKLQNQTPDTALYALNSEAPPGFQVTFKANYKQVASVSINPNQTENVTIDVKAPDEIPAGTYKIPVFAATSGSTAGLELEVVVTGSYSLDLSTPTGLLSTKVTAGDETKLQMVVKNTGSAPVTKVALSASAPAKWSVTFNPATIDQLAAGQSADVTATIKADKDAIAGDYVTNMEAKTSETSGKAEIRVSVTTPMIWGWIGILIILIAVASVYYLFRKYGRR